MGKFGWSYPPGCEGVPADDEPELTVQVELSVSTDKIGSKCTRMQCKLDDLKRSCELGSLPSIRNAAADCALALLTLCAGEQIDLSEAMRDRFFELKDAFEKPDGAAVAKLPDAPQRKVD